LYWLRSMSTRAISTRVKRRRCAMGILSCRGRGAAVQPKSEANGPIHAACFLVGATTWARGVASRCVQVSYRSQASDGEGV
jgi:hypothetical protein